jgi:hypothetical protein
LLTPPRKKIAVALTGLLMIASLAFTGHLNIQQNERSLPASGDSIKPASASGETLTSPHKALSSTLYNMAVHGYQQLAEDQKLSKQLLTIIDFSKPSTEKRLFIIDMQQQKVLVHTYVAHGSNSGVKFANAFSNLHESHQSSLGFFLTAGTYEGSNGYSMKLKGLEPGINDNAERRAIVMHGAPYVSEQVIKNTGRLGRSWGCPAVSQKEHKMIIDLIKQGSCMFIYAPDKKYLAQSGVLQGFGGEDIL